MTTSKRPWKRSMRRRTDPSQRCIGHIADPAFRAAHAIARGIFPKGEDLDVEVQEWMIFFYFLANYRREN